MAPAEALALGVLVGVVVADGVGDGAGLVLAPGVGEGAGVCPEPELAGKAVRRWLVDAWMAVSAAIATTKMTTQSPATASHRRRRTGRPAAQVAPATAGSMPEGSRARAPAAGTELPAGPVAVASAFDQSVRRAATATRRS